MIFIFRIICILLIANIAFAESSLEASLNRYLKEEIEPNFLEGSKLSIKVIDLENELEVFSYNPDILLTPASLLKIITTIAAFKFLGSEYTFPTEIFVDSLPAEENLGLDSPLSPREKDSPKWKAGNLYIRGYGDPSLVQEDLSIISEAVYSRGIRELEDLIIDDSLFIDPPSATGTEPYQAGHSSVSVNYNCYVVTVSPASLGLKPFVQGTQGVPYVLRNLAITRLTVGANIDVVFTPLGQSEEIEQRVTGEIVKPKILVTVNGRIGKDSQPVVIYKAVSDILSYSGYLYKYNLQKTGVNIRGHLLHGETASSAKLVYIHKSKPLSEILRDLNHYSNNFIAGQILYALGQDKSGFFRKEIGLSRLKAVLEDANIDPSGVKIVDASGLSKENRISVNQIAKLLVSVYKNFSLAPDFIASLSRYSKSGTLRNRRLIPVSTVKKQSSITRRLTQRAESAWGKTGTLDGVSSIAGYLEAENEKRYAYAIISNNFGEKLKPRDMEDEILKILAGLDDKKKDENIPETVDKKGTENNERSNEN